jgi:hypothetical protein
VVHKQAGYALDIVALSGSRDILLALGCDPDDPFKQLKRTQP